MPLSPGRREGRSDTLLLFLISINGIVFINRRRNSNDCAGNTTNDCSNNSTFCRTRRFFICLRGAQGYGGRVSHKRTRFFQQLLAGLILSWFFFTFAPQQNKQFGKQQWYNNESTQSSKYSNQEKQKVIHNSAILLFLCNFWGFLNKHLRSKLRCLLSLPNVLPSIKQ